MQQPPHTTAATKKPYQSVTLRQFGSLALATLTNVKSGTAADGNTKKA